MNIIDDDHQKLLQRSIEEDTRIISAKYVRVAGIPMLLELWIADGIRGSTALFLTEHVSELDDAELQDLLTKHGFDLGSSGVTIVRDDEHVYINFGFVAN